MLPLLSLLLVLHCPDSLQQLDTLKSKQADLVIRGKELHIVAACDAICIRRFSVICIYKNTSGIPVDSSLTAEIGSPAMALNKKAKCDQATYYFSFQKATKTWHMLHDSNDYSQSNCQSSKSEKK